MQHDTLASFRLSPQQKRLWQVCRAGLEGVALARCSIRIYGSLQAERLKVSIQRAVNRFEILRTTFRCPPGVNIPLQVVAEEIEVPILWYDWEGMASEQQESRLAGIYEEMNRVCFDLEHAPLLRAHVVRLASERHCLMFAISSFCIDRISMGNLLGELCNGYAAVNGEATYSKVIQYPDFSEWQDSLFESSESETGIDFWCERRISATGGISFTKRRFEPRRFRAQIDFGCEIQEALKRFQVPSPEFLLLASWQILLHRLTGIPRITIGVECDGRNYAELIDAVGLIARTLPIQQEFRKGLTGGQLVEQAGRLSEEARRFQEYFRWEKFFEEDKVERQVIFLPYGFFYGREQGDREAVGIRFEMEHQDFWSEPHQVKLICQEKNEKLMVEFEYDPELLTARDMGRYAASLKMILWGLIADPSLDVGRLEVVGPEERQWLLEEFNATVRNFPVSKSFHELFEEQVERSPDAVAVICGKEQLSYKNLNERANQLAYHLCRLGVGPEIRVGICIERSIEMVTGLLGILKAGGAYVALDPNYPQNRLSFILEDGKIPVLLSQQKFLGKLPKSKALVIGVEDFPWHAGSREDRRNLLSRVDPLNLAYVIYTSGSTGEPKGVMISHRGLVNYLSWCKDFYSVAGGPGSIVHSPLGFDLTITGLFAPLLVGKPIGLVPDAEETEELGESIRRADDVGLVKITPAHLEILGSSLPAEDARGRVRTFVIGGEALKWETLAFWRSNAPGTRLINEYGPTETVVGCCVYEVGVTDEISGTVPIGRPIANTQLYVLDEFLTPVPTAATGELFIGGEGLARGYENRPDLTAERFLPNPFGGRVGMRLYRTGDRVRHLPEGDLDFIGRIDRQVKLRGYRIELEEIETVLEQHPAVRQNVVAMREDVPGSKRLAAYLILRDGITISTGELRDYLKNKLPDYMLPSAFVILANLPLTANGKVDRKALPAPEERHLGSAETFIEPRNPIEATLAEIWSKVLRVQRVSVHDNFFELGGDSILSIQVVARARQAGLRLTSRELFQGQTVAKLAKIVEVADDHLTVGQRQVSGAVVLTPVQQWFFEQELLDAHYYNQAVILKVQQIEPEVVQQVMSQLVEQHDALRLRFEREEDSWKQSNSIAESNRFFSQIDLSKTGPLEQKTVLTAAAEQLQGSLNLQKGPLIRAVWFDLGAGEPARLLIIVHHLAVDGVSWRILLDDLQRGCANLQRGEAVSPGRKGSSFREWAARLQAHAQSEEVHQELEYWRAVLSHEFRPIAVDKIGGTNTISSERSVRRTLNEDETRRLLQEVAEKHRTQINDVLLTALVCAFGSIFKEYALLVNLEGHGREELFSDLDVTRTVGWFTAIFPVELAIKPGLEVGEALTCVREQMRTIPRRGIGYGLLRYLSLDGREKLGELPQPEISFNYLGRFDQVLEGGGIFSAAGEEVGPNRSNRGARMYLLDINCAVMGGQLGISWGYSESVHERGTIERLAEEFLKYLQAIIDYCQNAEAEGYKPSDFDKIRIDQKELDRLLSEITEVMEDQE